MRSSTNCIATKRTNSRKRPDQTTESNDAHQRNSRLFANRAGCPDEHRRIRRNVDPNRFDFATAAQRIIAAWDEAGCWRATVNPDRKPFTIVIPPPNVTGALHLGHGLNNTLQDVLIRTRRMQGFEALWMPGTDHAGIATQAVVERRLKEQENKTRHDLGREALVERIWQWKAQYERVSSAN
jgi:valyl-tRNA synthetase